MPSAASRNAIGLEILRAAAERNAAVEIHCTARDGGRAVLRSRILQIDDETVTLDRPSISADVPLRCENLIEIYFVFREQLYSFEARVVDPNRIVEFTGGKFAPGVAVSMPRAVRPGQRRDNFRVSLAVGDTIAVELHRASSTSGSVDETDTFDGGSAPIDAIPMDGMLVDLSTGGAGVRIEPEHLREIAPGGSVFLSFTLPDTDDTLTLFASVRQKREITGGAGGRIGLQFLPWPTERELRHHQNKLQRFVRNVERKQLKRAG